MKTNCYFPEKANAVSVKGNGQIMYTEDRVYYMVGG